MDVWFDSGSSWSMLKDLTLEPRAALADVCVEGSDQHRGWFQSQLLTSVGSSGEPKAPYGTLITHGMVLDQSGKKMSKSVGNIVRPATVINGGKVRCFIGPVELELKLFLRIKRRSLPMALTFFDCGLQQLNQVVTVPLGQQF